MNKLKIIVILIIHLKEMEEGQLIRRQRAQMKMLLEGKRKDLELVLEEDKKDIIVVEGTRRKRIINCQICDKNQ